MAEQRAERVHVEGLEWDGGAPMPVLLATDHRTVFACYMPTDDERVVVGEVKGCTSVRFGFPNDEVVHGHPCGLDLMHYRVHIIHHSPWLDDLRKIESVHPESPSPPFRTAHHYCLTFHDSSLEAIATRLAVAGTFDTMDEATTAMLVQAKST